MIPEIISRSEAKTRGLSKYFTGTPCKHGHIVERWTINWTCLSCRLVHDKKYREANPKKRREFHRRWRAANPKKVRAQASKWYTEHKEKALEKARNWHAANPEKVAASSKKWRLANLEVYRVHVRARRARQRGALGSHTAAEVSDLLIRQKWRCANAACRISLKERRSLDHIMPLRRGGSNDITNLQWLCPRCNSRKNAKHPIEWARANGRLL
jgi:HNH endonuclease